MSLVFSSIPGSGNSSSEFFDAKGTRGYSSRVVGEFANKACQLNSMEFRTGDSPNEVSFFVPFDEVYNENNLPYDAGDGNNPGEIVCVEIYNVRGRLAYSFYYQLTSYSFTSRGHGQTKGVTYRGKDRVRLWAKRQIINKVYNNFDKRDYYDDVTPDLGFYWTNENGIVEFVPANRNSNNYLGLIDAYHAVVDLFYTPKRFLENARSIQGMDGITSGTRDFGYPVLDFDPYVEADLKEFIIPQKDYRPSDILTAILDILQSVNSKYSIVVTAKGPSLSDHTVTVTRIGNGPSIEAIANSNDQEIIEKFAIQNHNPKRKKLIVLSDRSEVNTENQIDYLKYEGAPRQYFVRNAPLLPAWDWWNDYNLWVRRADDLKIITEFFEDGTMNPEYPSFLRGVVTESIRAELNNLAKIHIHNDPENPSGRLALFAAISALWAEIANRYYTANPQDRSRFIVNMGVVDCLRFPTDPLHRYRFKRFIAVPPNEDPQFYVPNMTPEGGWDHPDLKRFKNIMPTLIDGKRQDIKGRYFTEELRNVETSHLQIGPIVEAELPSYGPYGYNKTGMTARGTKLEWKMVKTVEIDGPNGYFTITDPVETALYVDKATIVAGYNKNGLYVGDSGNSSQPTNPDDDRREGVFKTWIMSPGGPTSVQLATDYIYFRARMRATFYYEKAQSYREPVHGLGDGTQSRTYFDMTYPDPVQNEVFLAGIVTPHDLGINRNVSITNSNTRFAKYVDQNMVWQCAFDPNDPSAQFPYKVSLGDGTGNGILATDVLLKDRERGRFFLSVEWTHRDDRALLFEKAKRKLLERLEPQYGGVIETLDMFDVGYFNNLTQSEIPSNRYGFVAGIVDKASGPMKGMGEIVYKGAHMPIAGYTVSFPEMKSTIEFDLTPVKIGVPFEPDRIIKVNAYEYFRREGESKGVLQPTISRHDEGSGQPRRVGEAFGGYKHPWVDGKPDRYYHTKDSNYGKYAQTIPGPSNNNAALTFIHSLAGSIFVNDNEAEQTVFDAIRNFPEASGCVPRRGEYNKNEGLI